MPLPWVTNTVWHIEHFFSPVVGCIYLSARIPNKGQGVEGWKLYMMVLWSGEGTLTHCFSAEEVNYFRNISEVGQCGLKR